APRCDSRACVNFAVPNSTQNLVLGVVKWGFPIYVPGYCCLSDLPCRTVELDEHRIFANVQGVSLRPWWGADQSKICIGDWWSYPQERLRRFQLGQHPSRTEQEILTVDRERRVSWMRVARLRP